MKRALLPAVAVVLLLSGCVILPTAPTVTVLPGSRKNFDQFRVDDAMCRNYAQSTVEGPSHAAVNNAATNAAVGTVLGAAAGAVLGSVSGQAGQGAAIGAGTGLLFGSAAGSGVAGYSSYQLQHQYDIAYLQCMYAHGNQVPGRVVYRRPATDDSIPSYPPPNYPPPNLSPEGNPPASYPPPDVSPGNYPPPNTPPPPG